MVSLQTNDNCLRRFERVEGKAQGVPRGRCGLKIRGLSEELIFVRVVDEERDLIFIGADRVLLRE